MAKSWLIGFPSWREDVSYSGGSWLAAYPLSNLSRLPFAKVTRSTNTSFESTKFRGSFAEPRLLEVIRLDHHNMSKGGRFRVHLFEFAGDSDPIVSTAWIEAFPAVYDETASQASWDSGNWWDRTYSDRDLKGTPLARNVYIPGAYTVKAFEVEIQNEDNPAGFVQIGLLEPAAAILLRDAPEHGAQAGMISRTVVTQSEGGGKSFERRGKARTFSGTLPYVHHDEALSLYYELMRQNDVDIPFIWWPNVGSPLHELRESYLARFTQLDPFTRILADADSVPMNNEEVL